MVGVLNTSRTSKQLPNRNAGGGAVRADPGAVRGLAPRRRPRAGKLNPDTRNLKPRTPETDPPNLETRNPKTRNQNPEPRTSETRNRTRRQYESGSRPSSICTIRSSCLPQPPSSVSDLISSFNEESFRAGLRTNAPTPHPAIRRLAA